MLSSLKPANGKFVLGPPVETEPPVVVFTGPANKPDTRCRPRAPAEEEKEDRAPRTASKEPKRPSTCQAGETAKPKVSSASQ